MTHCRSKEDRMDTNTLSDPARLAQAVRSLAQEAHRTLKHAPTPAALRRLSRRVARLSSALGDRRDTPLGAWLASVGREVRGLIEPQSHRDSERRLSDP